MEKDNKPFTEEFEEKTKLRNVLRDKAVDIVLGVATLGLTALGMYSSYKRNNRKAEAYINHLDDKLELQREALGLYKDSLEPERPSAQDTLME